MPDSKFYRPGVIIALVLFALWFVFNQGKATKLGLFGEEAGLMYTSPSWPDIFSGIVVHGVILCICGAIGFAIGAVLKRCSGDRSHQN